MSFITFVPIEKNESARTDWNLYVACIVAACASDGLSDAEKLAVGHWLALQGQSASVLDEALVTSRSLTMAAVSANKSAAFFGPYIVRDAIRMCRIDGLGAKERAAIASLAEALGVTAQSVTAIETLIEQHDAAEASWKSLLKA
jgi:hypothetical protein